VAGEVVGTFGSLEVGPANRFRKFKISRASPDQSGHVPAWAKDGAKVVTVGAHIETFGAVNFEVYGRQSNFQNLVSINPHASGGAIDRLSFSG
jgi:hypothetical protein